MKRLYAHRAAIGLALLSVLSAGAQAITVAEIERLLQAAPQGPIRFEEIRESPWLPAPIESSGHFHSTANMLEKRVEHPREETWRILSDRMERIGPDPTSTTRLYFKDVPAVAMLAEALRRIVAGDLQALATDFTIAAQGDEQLWTVQLEPRNSRAANALASLELRGTRHQLRVIVVVERKGERTTTRLYPER